LDFDRSNIDGIFQELSRLGVHPTVFWMKHTEEFFKKADDHHRTREKYEAALSELLRQAPEGSTFVVTDDPTVEEIYTDQTVPILAGHGYVDVLPDLLRKALGDEVSVQTVLANLRTAGSVPPQFERISSDLVLSLGVGRVRVFQKPSGLQTGTAAFAEKVTQVVGSDTSVVSKNDLRALTLKLMASDVPVKMGVAAYGATGSGLTVERAFVSQAQDILAADMSDPEKVSLMRSAMLGAARALQNKNAMDSQSQLEQFFQEPRAENQAAYAHFVVDKLLTPELLGEIRSAVGTMKKAAAGKSSPMGVIVTVKDPAMLDRVEQWLNPGDLAEDLPRNALLLVRAADSSRDFIGSQLSLTGAVADALKAEGKESELSSARVQHFVHDLTDVTLELPGWASGDASLQSLRMGSLVFLLLNTAAVPIQPEDLGNISPEKLRAVLINA
jgi:hypothetical protein